MELSKGGAISHATILEFGGVGINYLMEMGGWLNSFRPNPGRRKALKVLKTIIKLFEAPHRSPKIKI